MSSRTLRPGASGILLCFMAVAGSWLMPNSLIGEVKAPKDRKSAPTFTLKDSSGGDLRLPDYKGKVVLLNFWATWCGPCKVEMPWFVEFEQTYKDSGFSVIGVSMDEDGWDVVKPYLASKHVNYRVVIGNEQLTKSYGDVESLPTTFLIDRDGRIASVHTGLVDRAEYEREIRQLLGMPKGGQRRN